MNTEEKGVVFQILCKSLVSTVSVEKEEFALRMKMFSRLSTRWRTPTAPTGILTVSIDNPTARTQPEWVSAQKPWRRNTSVDMKLWNVLNLMTAASGLWFICRPPTAWTLHPPAPSAVPVKMETTEKKIPKGVPLQFDINSVGKPVGGAAVRRTREFVLAAGLTCRLPSVSAANVHDVKWAVPHLKRSTCRHGTEQ